MEWKCTHCIQIPFLLHLLSPRAPINRYYLLFQWKGWQKIYFSTQLCTFPKNFAHIDFTEWLRFSAFLLKIAQLLTFCKSDHQKWFYDTFPSFRIYFSGCMSDSTSRFKSYEVILELQAVWEQGGGGYGSCRSCGRCGSWRWYGRCLRRYRSNRSCGDCGSNRIMGTAMGLKGGTFPS